MSKRFASSLLLAAGLVLPVAILSCGGIGIRLALPPPWAVAGTPDLVVIPGTYVYAVVGAEADIYFYGGWWWRHWDGRWYHSRNYRSGWQYVPSAPGFYRRVPSNWRHNYQERHWEGKTWNTQHLPEPEVRRNWQEWEKNNHWEKHNTWGVENYHSNREHHPGPGDGKKDRGHDRGR